MPDDLRARIAELRQLRDAASPLPWVLFGDPDRWYIGGPFPKSGDKSVGWEALQYAVAAANLAPRLADAWEQAMAAIAERDARELEELRRLRKMVSRDCVMPCSCCGTMLSWQFAGDGTNCLEVATGLNHACDYSIESAPPGTYRYLERQVAERDAEIARLKEEVKGLSPQPPCEEHEAIAARFRAEQRKGDGKPEGTRESLEVCARMLDIYGPECFPANEKGQVHFARAMMESVADEIRAYLAADAPKGATCDE